MNKNKLKTTRTKYSSIPYEEELPEGVFECPNCTGRGQIYKYEHGCPGIIHNPNVNLYTMCFVCMGKGVVKKCIDCGNIISIFGNLNRCSDCVYKKYVSDK